MDPTMELRIGSFAKTFIAKLALQLAENGAIGSLDDLIGKYIPSYVPFAWANSVTVRMLATMSSGIPDFIDSQSRKRFWGNNPYYVLKPQELLANVINERLVL